jgi:uncharacterized membrane protein
MLRRAALLALILAAACGQDVTRPNEVESLRVHPGPSFLPLPVGEAVWSMAYGVSAGGWAAGEVDLTDTDWHAARWRVTVRHDGTPVATLQDLGALHGRPTIAFDANDRGVVVGGSLEFSAGLGDGPDEAFVYRDHMMQTLPTLGGPNAFARRINNHDWIVGQSDTPTGESHATVWRPRRDGGYSAIDLGTLGGSFSWCNTIDDAGRVVGLSEDATGAVIAWWWAGHGPLHPLRSLTPGGANFAVDFNARGVIVGNGTIEDGSYHAARWLHGGIQDLHGRFPGFVNSFATGINLDNDIVVSAYDPDDASTAFLLRGNATIDLGQAAAMPSSDVYDISDRGWVAGGAGEDGIFSAGLWLPGGFQRAPATVGKESIRAGPAVGMGLPAAHGRAARRLRMLGPGGPAH